MRARLPIGIAVTLFSAAFLWAGGIRAQSLSQPSLAITRVRAGETEIVGTAFVVASRGGFVYILTAAHNLGCDAVGGGCATTASVAFADDNGISYTARTLRSGTFTARGDLALLTLRHSPLPAVTIASSVAVGIRTNAAGYAGGAFHMSYGSITAVRAGGEVIEYDDRTLQGMSGGPVFDPLTGTVAGLVRGEDVATRIYSAVGPAAMTAFLRNAGIDYTAARQNAAFDRPVGANPLSPRLPYERFFLREPPARAERVQDLTAKANIGDGSAMATLGYDYAYGAGVPQSDSAAFSWDTRAAERGDPRGIYQLGIDYETGLAVRQNLPESVNLYRRSAGLGYAPAGYLFGYALLFGQGIPADYAAARDAFVRASADGSTDALTMLGNIYAFGIGIEADETRAAAYYRQARDRYERACFAGDGMACEAVGALYASGEGGERDDVAAAALYQRGLALGNPWAGYELGVAFENGKGVPRSASRALSAYRAAARFGDVKSMVRIGDFYWVGRVVRRDARTAVQWYRRASARGSETAAFGMGLAYRYGRGVRRDLRTAIAWFDLAARRGSASAAADLGFLYWKTGRNREAFQYDLRAAKSGDVTAEYNLGVDYDNGLGVKADARKAFFYYEQAAEQGYAPAERAVADAYDAADVVAPDTQAELGWYTKAADQHDSSAEFSLYQMYVSGEGVIRNQREALRWLLRAQADGSSDAATEVRKLRSDQPNILQVGTGAQDPEARIRAIVADVLAEDGTVLGRAFSVHSDDRSSIFLTTAQALGCDATWENCPGGTRLRIGGRIFSIESDPAIGSDEELRLVRVAYGGLPEAEFTVDADVGEELRTWDTQTNSAKSGLLANLSVAGTIVDHSIPLDVQEAGSPLYDPLTGNVLAIARAHADSAISSVRIKSFLQQHGVPFRNAGYNDDHTILLTADDLDRYFRRPVPFSNDRRQRDASERAAEAWAAIRTGVPANRRAGAAMLAGAASRDTADPVLLLYLAFSKYNGDEGYVDFGTAADLFSRATTGFAAAAAENPSAAYWLGVMNREGLGMPRNDAIANTWFKRAALGGSIDARVSLAYAVEWGLGVPQEPTDAYNMLAPLAPRSGEAAFLAGEIKYNREEPDKKPDYERAVHWYRIAANAGVGMAWYRLGECYEYGVGVRRDGRLERAAYRRALLAGVAKAATELGYIYEHGTGVNADSAMALRYYRIAAAAGEDVALHNLGVVYRDGRGVARDYTRARRYFADASDLGNGDAQNDLGVAYTTGKGAPRDRTQALNWYEIAAENGNATGQLNLGDRYRSGSGVPRDLRLADAWYLRSANQGLPRAEYRLARAFATGAGLPRNARWSRIWMERAAASGENTAQLELAKAECALHHAGACAFWGNVALRRSIYQGMYSLTASERREALKILAALPPADRVQGARLASRWVVKHQ